MWSIKFLILLIIIHKTNYNAWHMIFPWRCAIQCTIPLDEIGLHHGNVIPLQLRPYNQLKEHDREEHDREVKGDSALGDVMWKCGVENLLTLRRDLSCWICVAFPSWFPLYVRCNVNGKRSNIHSLITAEENVINLHSLQAAFIVKQTWHSR